jgi:hypothetical protein
MCREAADEREAWAIALGISTAATLFAGREAVSARVCGQGLRLVLSCHRHAIDECQRPSRPTRIRVMMSAYRSSGAAVAGGGGSSSRVSCG